MAPNTAGSETMVRIDLNATPFDRANAFLVNASRPGYNVGYIVSDTIPPIHTDIPGQHHDKCLVPALKLRSVTLSPIDPNIASSVYELDVLPELCNATGNLHGGAVALIMDMCTSTTVAPVAREGFWDNGHVSRTLNCTYLRPAPVGAKCTVESEIVHLGKRIGMVRGVIKREDGAVCYTCEHGKAAVNLGGKSMI